MIPRDVISADCSALIADFGVSVEFEGTVTVGVLDAPGRNIEFSGLPQVCTTDYTLLFKTEDLPGLKSGSQITVDGKLYRVRDAQPIEDGLMSQATLARVS